MSVANDPLDAPDLVRTLSDLHRDARTVVAFEPDEHWARLADDLEALEVQTRAAARPPWARRKYPRLRGFR